ncbi:MAG: DUF1304 domain-containing protein [Candidatus Limnocylindrales bacterium]
MNVIDQVAAVVGALIHVWFFVLESIRFTEPRVWARFGLRSQEEAANARSFAFNQGFYNLFLAIGVGLGLVVAALGSLAAGEAIILFACGSMVAAGIVLVVHNPAFARAAAIQAGPPLVAILAAVLLPA